MTDTTRSSSGTAKRFAHWATLANFCYLPTSIGVVMGVLGGLSSHAGPFWLAAGWFYDIGIGVGLVFFGAQFWHDRIHDDGDDYHEWLFDIQRDHTEEQLYEMIRRRICWVFLGNPLTWPLGVLYLAWLTLLLYLRKTPWWAQTLIGGVAGTFVASRMNIPVLNGTFVGLALGALGSRFAEVPQIASRTPG